MSTRLSTKNWDYEPTVHFRNPVRHVCGCGREAKYLVYSHKQPHCHGCLCEAIEGQEMVPVSSI